MFTRQSGMRFRPRRGVSCHDRAVPSRRTLRLTWASPRAVVGFGDGAKRVWIDVLFFDESAALPIVRSVFAADARVTAAELYSFDRHELEPRTRLK